MRWRRGGVGGGGEGAGGGGEGNHADRVPHARFLLSPIIPSPPRLSSSLTPLKSSSVK